MSGDIGALLNHRTQLLQAKDTNAVGQANATGMNIPFR